MTPNHTPRIFVAGHDGMVGSAIMRALRRQGVQRIVTRTRAELDLRDQDQVRAFFATAQIDQVYLAAAMVGGIHANQTYPAEFIHANLAIASNVIHEAWRHGVERLLYLGSSCIYPRVTPQPIPEVALLSGPLEPSNEPYAVAKIAGIKLCESYNRQFGVSFRSLMPTNLFGPGDNYHPENSHVIPGLLRRFHEAAMAGSAEVLVWGSGEALREFLYVDDLAAACQLVMALSDAHYRHVTSAHCSHINVGYGSDIRICDLARQIAALVGFRGRIVYDRSRPDGTPRKLLDSRLIRGLGWKPRVTLGAGLRETYHSFLRAQQEGLRNMPARALDAGAMLARQRYAGPGAARPAVAGSPL